MNFAKSILVLSAVISLSACSKNDPAMVKMESGLATNPNSPKSVAQCSPQREAPDVPGRLIKSDYRKGDVECLCNAAISNTRDRLAMISKITPDIATYDNTMLAFESSVADFSDDTTTLTFMKYVSTDKDVQAEGAACEEKVGNFSTEIFIDKKMYAVLKLVPGRNDGEKRLSQQTLLSFEQNGMNLSDADLVKLKALNDQLTKLQADYSNNLNLDKSHIEVTAAELAGLPQTFIDRQKKNADGTKLVVNANEADYPIVMANATNEKTRHDMMQAYLTRGGETNLKLLSDAVVVREQIAKMVMPAKGANGKPADQTWVAYKVRTRMAKTRAIVTTFLDGLKDKLAARNKQDFDQLLAYKKTIVPGTKVLNAWDVGFMVNQLKKLNFAVDEEEIRKYFPADVVIDGLFGVYSEMLGVDYREVQNARVWADGVKLYEIHEHSDGHLIGYFYTDFYPRPDTGKYSHAAAFPIFSGRMMPSGNYSYPVSSIVANISPPVNGQAALLSHDDVETIFHEFGHIMHQTLTKAPYASLSGSSVAQDFVEAPSQMLENWVWQPEILKRLSGLASDHSQHLPDDLLAKMIAARDFQQGNLYTKQLLYSSYDINIHSQSGPVDVNKTYHDLYVKLMGQQPIDGQMFPASFGHLMGGYDAGYYGYLWSKVYAQDMFSVFKAAGVTSPEVGKRYRTVILENGNMKDALDLLPLFLLRAPSKNAFYEDLHIKP